MRNANLVFGENAAYEKILALIANRQYREIFRGGHCYEWALRVHLDRLPYAQVRYFKNEYDQTHAYLYLPKLEKFLDCTGVYTTQQSLLSELDFQLTATMPETWEVESLRAQIEKNRERRGYSKRTVAVIMEAALTQFDEDSRFAGDAFTKWRCIKKN